MKFSVPLRYFLLVLSLLLGLSGPARAQAPPPRPIKPVPAPAQPLSLTLTGMQRVYDDNSTWTIATARTPAAISLKNRYADGSEWLASAGGKPYHIKRTYDDDSEWKIAETGTTLRQTYAHDRTAWQVLRGPQTAPVALRDRYQDGSQWDGDGLSLTRKYADGSAWTIADQTPTQPLDVKLLLVFAALYSNLNRP